LLIAYAKQEGEDILIVCVNLDPFLPREGLVSIPAELELPPSFAVRDLLSSAEWRWSADGNYVRLAPGQSHVLEVGQ
jgi:hypothetical protein